jgi:hypothetical protein
MTRYPAYLVIGLAVVIILFFEYPLLVTGADARKPPARVGRFGASGWTRKGGGCASESAGVATLSSSSTLLPGR